jgi:hypothetical protein
VRGGGGSGGSAPSLHLSALDSKLGKVDKAGKLKFQTKLNEPATVSVSARSSQGVKVATGREKVGKGTDKMSAKLTLRGEHLIAKAKKLKLEVAATAKDADGNSSKSRLKLTLD